ncbi:hypothetical protein FRC08_007577 [Ceratobasidium sp. 394]|nr:hypothetical protein FRC08_007577 [Ceratobasidium sp. 394]
MRNRVRFNSVAHVRYSTQESTAQDPPAVFDSSPGPVRDTGGRDNMLTPPVEGPISSQDAAIMISAFRQMMRKPDFTMRPEDEGDAPQNTPEEEYTQLFA